MHVCMYVYVCVRALCVTVTLVGLPSSSKSSNQLRLHLPQKLCFGKLSCGSSRISQALRSTGANHYLIADSLGCSWYLEELGSILMALVLVHLCEQ